VLRYVNREVSPAAREALESQMPEGAQRSMAEYIELLAASADPKVAALADKLRLAGGRDAEDHTRLRALYGIDYRDRAAYDLVVDTDGKTPEQVLAEVITALPAGFVPGAAAAPAQSPAKPLDPETATLVNDIIRAPVDFARR
jgi:hypothetical protein